MVMPGDRVPVLLQLHHQDRENLELVLRQLATIIDSIFSQFFLLISKLIELLLQHAIKSEEAIQQLISNDTPRNGERDYSHKW
jgi:hypothetical protein